MIENSLFFALLLSTLAVGCSQAQTTMTTTPVAADEAAPATEAKPRPPAPMVTPCELTSQCGF